MSRDYTSQLPGGPDRRRTRRFTTDRLARVADALGYQPLRTARVVDMSPTGLCIESHHEINPGEAVEIEIDADDGGELTLLRGEVMHTASIGPAKFRNGIECHYNVRGTLAVVTRTKVAAENRAAALSTAAPKLRVVLPANRRSGRRRYLLGAALALALMLLALVPDEAEKPVASASGGGGALFRSMSLLRAQVEDGTVTVGTMAEAARFSRVVNAAIDEERGVADNADAGADQRAGVARESQARRFHGQLDLAEEFARRGERALAIEAVQTALADSDSIPEAWTDRAWRELDSLEQKSPAASFMPMNTELELAAATSVTGDPSLLIEVDTANYVLHVRSNNAILKSFPVGLGRNGATPLGRFLVVDKIANPDWYDRGATVPAGSPENPLGASWMGLGQGGRGTGFGIHPALGGQGIEQPASRGCVRLSPADAEALFRLAPAGTPVWIHE